MNPTLISSDDRIPLDPRRGRLTLYFGVAPGVGKTHAMLEAAQQARHEGVDVVVGAADTHGRAETEALLLGLERLPPRQAYVRGKLVEELDFEAALARRPGLLVVDDLAHTNAPGSRHARRWQDVLDLLAAGIDVMATLCVQHLESLHNVAVQITSLRTYELVPDVVFERAEQPVVFIDTPPEVVLARLQEGKVAVPEHEAQAATALYRKTSLLALRELALRRMAQRAGRENPIYRSEPRASPGAPSERILVCVDPTPLGPRLVRAAFRMATGLRADWLALYVETPGLALAGEGVRAQIGETLRLAESLGAEVAHINGDRIDREILAFARSRGVTRLIIGKPVRHRWRELWRGSLVDALVRESGEIDVHVIAGDISLNDRPPTPVPRVQKNLAPYLWLALVVPATWGFWFFGVDRFYVVAFHFVGIYLVAANFGRGPAMWGAVLSSVAALLVLPRFSAQMDIDLLKRLWLLSLMMLMAWQVSALTERSRRQAEAARIDERRLTALYLLSRDLSKHGDEVNIVACTIDHVKKTIAGRAVILLPEGDGELVPLAGTDVELMADAREAGVAHLAFKYGPAGRGTDTLPAAQALYLPLTAPDGTIGVLGVAPDDPARLAGPAERQLLDAMTVPVALALQRVRLAEEAKRAEVRARAEKDRNALLSSVSHDLRTPLASITGAASTILQSDEEALAPETRRDLLQTIYDEAERLGRLVGNLLDMTRLEAGSVALRTDWVSLEDPIGAALTRLERRLAGREVKVSLSPELPLLAIDEVLFEQMMLNLIENACKYTPPGTPIRIAAQIQGGRVVVEVADRGPGLPAGAEEAIFDKFVRGSEAKAHGFGLGLAICRGIASAHGGTITAGNRPGGGAVFRVSLPVGIGPPAGPEVSMAGLGPAEVKAT